MPRFAALAALLLSFAAVSPASVVGDDTEHASAMGTHGMALFGGAGALYASHLPMFHAPHDTQLVMRVRFEDARVDTRLRASLEAEPALWTFVPERADLHRVGRGDAPVMKLRGDIVQGHFERGGVTRHSGVVMRIEKVELDRRLDATPRTTASASYRVLAAGGASFAVKLIDARPDYEHIARIDGCAAAPQLETGWNETGADAGARLGAVLADTCPGARVRTIYLETADLR